MPGIAPPASSAKTSLELALTRRELLAAAAFVAAGALLPRGLLAAAPFAPAAATQSALAASRLVYISPLKQDGHESACHGEVWYWFDGSAVWIGTSAKSWKARAVAAGRQRARLWVGDLGVYAVAGEKVRTLPTFAAEVTRETDSAAQAKLLEAFGKKYAAEWGKWGPRFENGFKDGSRALLKYTPAGA